MQITVGAETVDKLRRVQDLMRHIVPDGDPAVILNRALTMLLEHLERTKLAATAAPRARHPLTAGSRHIPARVRRAVWARDEGRCAFVGTTGRCQERGFLEFHHIVPYAAGGEATVDTIALRCKAHNLYEAEQDFGPRVSEHTKRAKLYRDRSGGPPLLLRERAEPFGRQQLGPDRVVSWCLRLHPRA